MHAKDKSADVLRRDTDLTTPKMSARRRNRPRPQERQKRVERETSACANIQTADRPCLPRRESKSLGHPEPSRTAEPVRQPSPKWQRFVAADEASSISKAANVLAGVCEVCTQIELQRVSACRRFGWSFDRKRRMWSCAGIQQGEDLAKRDGRDIAVAVGMPADTPSDRIRPSPRLPGIPPSPPRREVSLAPDRWRGLQTCWWSC